MDENGKKNGISVHMSGEELAALINTLSFAKAVFEKSAQMTLKSGDADSAEQLNERAHACTMFIDRLLKNMEIGEPSSTYH